jgi:hypothetical protein
MVAVPSGNVRAEVSTVVVEPTIVIGKLTPGSVFLKSWVEPPLVIAFTAKWDLFKYSS